MARTEQTKPINFCLDKASLKAKKPRIAEVITILTLTTASTVESLQPVEE